MIADPSTPRDQSQRSNSLKDQRQFIQERMFMRLGMMIGVHAMMSDAQCDELTRWEDEHRPLGLGTSDWPGWAQWLLPEPPHLPHSTTKKQPVSKHLRAMVFQRDGHRCASCGAENDLSVDHIIAESKGGPTTLANLQTLCRSCNSRKGTR